ncbi:MAG: hypothetical protein ACR2QU_02065 [Gammaproteobacteria bacterium]
MHLRKSVAGLKRDVSMRNFRWPVEVTRPVAASASQVWDVLSMPGNLELCHPHCKRNPVQIWPGANSRDRIEYLSGWIFHRRFRRWTEGVGYDLEIGPSGGVQSLVTWRIVTTGVQRCNLGITVYPGTLQKIPLAVRWLPHLLRIRPMLKRYLTSVIMGFESYVTRGEPVQHDQFGRHPWFSAR